MDFEPDTDQQAILESVERLLAKQAGPARAAKLALEGEYDSALDEALALAGFHDIARDLATPRGPALLEAALMVEAIARAAGVVAAASRLLILPLLPDVTPKGPIALCTLEELQQRTPLRFAAHASHLLVLEKNNVRWLDLTPGEMQAVRTSFGYPMGRPAADASCLNADSGEPLGAQAVHALRRGWRLALAVEAVGTMDAALAHTVSYLKQRRQFGRAIGSFQAIQHRLAQCAIQVEGSRWLAREAAWHGAPDEAAAAAAAFALHAADQLFSETHQMSGAIGFTREFDLHVWSMRLLALRQELAGVGGARRALVAARWGTAG
tara:strand:- start:7946 stop:8914 length:969 start_codon:yes stop_codon:yes gene_type:complete